MKPQNKNIILVFLNTLLILFLYDSTFSQNVTERHSGENTIVEVNKQEKIISKTPLSFPGFTMNENTRPEKITDNISLFNWTMKFSVPGKVFKDVSFADSQTGYIVTELGAVYKTTNGGDNWTVKMNLGFPYYWYGVDALSPDTLVISGFNNQGDIHSGVVRWSFNGGDTWSNDIILRIPNGVGWLSKVHFFDRFRGIVMAEFSGGVHYTDTGGKDSSSWHYTQINSDLAWFAGNIDAQANGNIYATGIHFAHGSDFGASWTTTNSADNVFDGGVDFFEPENLLGLTGGGQISAPVSGWIHRTTDNGLTWSDRSPFPYPVRALEFFNSTHSIAVGGNLYDEAGGIYSSTNGGIDWNIDVSTSAEMFAFDHKDISNDSTDIWCVGSTGGGTGFTGKLYKARTSGITAIDNEAETPFNFHLYQNYPNPFNPNTLIQYSLGKNSDVKIIIYNVLGKEVRTLVNKKQPAGSYSVNFKSEGLPSGIYFYRLNAEGLSETKRMILIK
ncbi:MAG: T9SS type A sorting domain-containing protein [Ignavibacteria bacterium]